MGVGDSKDVNVVPDDGLPSVELTRRFLALSDDYGSQESCGRGGWSRPSGWDAGSTRL